ncbi:unnamed protein product [Rotaria sp. Silwood2]|nr:unnamed protein product [Rotaria sp. Silwood2]CAF2972377.1 unnamed protein product [Rotaria sp. Silwood2]CAF3204794.1 unnamed protein product [Rotaria sp. Silwood2]CAF3382442.1 unnamed protein product [Rotaria sp. Silwood2]CAF4198015.1 unnamed protein product [Rotaria sp. Silwood2]
MQKKTPNKIYWVCIVKGCDVYAHTDINQNYLSGDEGTAKNRRKTIPPVPASCLFDIPNDFKLTIEKKDFY